MPSKLLPAVPYGKLLRGMTVAYPLCPFLAHLGSSQASSVSSLNLLLAAGFTVALCALPGALNFSRWTSAAWFILLNSLAAVVLYAVLVTGAFPNLATCMAVLKTNTAEAEQILQATEVAVVLVTLSWLLQLAGCISFSRTPPRFAFGTSRARILVTIPLAIPILASPVCQMYPVNLLELSLKVAQYAAASNQVDFADNFSVRSTRRENPAAPPELVVFVVGESSQAEYWQLLGYPQPSTPAMVRRHAAGELLLFSRHMSTVSLTWLAVPAIFSPFDELFPRASGRRPSLVSIMRRAGYATAWLSVHGAMPMVTEADVTHFTSDFEVTGFPGKYDDRLLGQAQTWLAQHRAKPGFLVLHTAGSHVPYEGRYPESAAHWHGHEEKLFPKSQTVGNYLNSVLYTDTILDKLMTQLSLVDRPVLLVYVSDHGESSMRGVSRDQAEVETMLHVPFFVWGNSQWRTRNTDQWTKMLHVAQRRPVTSHLNIVPTLTSVLHLDYEGKPGKRDLLSPAFEAWTRTPAIQPKTMSKVEVTPVP